MNIVVISQYFYPEEFKINELVEGFVGRGHHVTVLTGKPNYPKGSYYSGYHFSGIDKESYKGAEIIRVPLIKRGNGQSLKLFINYFSFVFFSCWYVLFHKINADAIFCWETSPIFQAYPALLLKHFCHCNVAMWVQDLWPESVSAASNIHQKIILKTLSKMVKHIYSKCDTIFIQSKAFKDSILAKGNFANKLIYAPNWAEDLFCNSNAIELNKYRTMIPDGFIVMFAGNIGAAQDFDNIIRAAILTKNHPDIKWIIIGDGRRRKEVEQTVIKEGLYKTVKFLGRFPVSEMPHFFVHANVMLVSLKKEYIFTLTIPSKIQAYLASRKPIVSMLSGIGNKVIQESKCGLTAESGDAKTLADNVIKLSMMEPSILKEMGESAEKYYNMNFSKNKVIDSICDHLF